MNANIEKELAIVRRQGREEKRKRGEGWSELICEDVF